MNATRLFNKVFGIAKQLGDEGVTTGKAVVSGVKNATPNAAKRLYSIATSDADGAVKGAQYDQAVKDFTDKADLKDPILAAVMRPYIHMPDNFQQALFRNIARERVFLSKYSKGVDNLVNRFNELPAEKKGARYEIIKLMAQKKLGTDEAKNYIDGVLGNGSHDIIYALHSGGYQDPLFGSPMLLNEGYVPDMTKTLMKRKKDTDAYFARMEKIAKVTTKTDRDAFRKAHVRQLQEDGYNEGALQLWASDKDNNLISALYRKMERNADMHIVLGAMYDEEANKLTRVGNRLVRTEDTPRTVQTTFRSQSDNPLDTTLGYNMQLWIEENKDNPDMKERVKAVSDMLQRLQKNPDTKAGILSKVMDAYTFSNLNNNLGTVARSTFDVLKTTASNKNIQDAASTLLSNENRPLRKNLLLSTDNMTQRANEFGRTMGKELIPDISQKAETYLKSHTWLANTLDTAEQLDPTGEKGLKSAVEKFFVTQDATYLTPDVLQSLAGGLKELNRTGSRVHPAFQRPMFNSNLSAFKLAETGINDLQEFYHNVPKALITREPEATKKAVASARTLAAKAALFGLGAAVIPSEVSDFVQERLPEDQQANMQNTRNALDKFGLVSGPASLLGMNTNALVQSGIPGPINLINQVPIYDDVKTLIGDGTAMSKKGQTTSTIAGATRLGALLSRVVAPGSATAGVLNAMNPSASGRLVYEGLVTAGIAPTSVAPTVYEVKGLGNVQQTPISYINAILGTNPDYINAKTQRLNGQ
jgi:hypothetical protein